jgi:hypothetical protein
MSVPHTQSSSRLGLQLCALPETCTCRQRPIMQKAFKGALSAHAVRVQGVLSPVAPVPVDVGEIDVEIGGNDATVGAASGSTPQGRVVDSRRGSPVVTTASAACAATVSRSTVSRSTARARAPARARALVTLIDAHHHPDRDSRRDDQADGHAKEQPSPLGRVARDAASRLLVRPVAVAPPSRGGPAERRVEVPVRRVLVVPEGGPAPERVLLGRQGRRVHRGAARYGCVQRVGRARVRVERVEVGVGGRLGEVVLRRWKGAATALALAFAGVVGAVCRLCGRCMGFADYRRET